MCEKTETNKNKYIKYTGIWSLHCKPDSKQRQQKASVPYGAILPEFRELLMTTPCGTLICPVKQQLYPSTYQIHLLSLSGKK